LALSYGGDEMSKVLGLRWVVWAVVGATLLLLVAACAAETEIVEVVKEVVVEKIVVKEIPVERIVEKEVIKEVAVERVVIKEVPVEKIVTQVVTKEVIKTVEVPVERIVTKEVVKIVEVEKPVIVEVERVVTKEVIVERIVVATPVVMARQATAYYMRAPEPYPKYGGLVRGGFGATTTHFDVHQGGGAHVLGHIYNNMLYENLSDGFRTIIGDLAESWESNLAQTEFTYQLRKGVKFHDGTPLTAQDVVASYSRIMFPPEGMISTQRDNFPFVKEVKAVDDLTVRVVLNEPRAFFQALLTGGGMVIYSKKSLDENNNDLKKVRVSPGTGAFKFVDFLEGEKWIYEANPDYFDTQIPYVDRLEIFDVPNLADRGTFVLTGQTDFTWNSSVDVKNEAKKQPDKFSVGEPPGFGCHVTAINNTRAPFDDVRVRRAMHLVIDRPVMREVYAGTEFMETTRWMVHGGIYSLTIAETDKFPGWRPEKDEDIATAKALMAAAGFADGISGVDYLVPNAAWASEILAPTVQAMLLKHLNIQTDIRIMDRALTYPEMRSGNFTLSQTTQGTVLPDPSLWFAKHIKTGAVNNFRQYSNATVDALLVKLEAETKIPARIALTRELEDFLDQDVPDIMLGCTNHAPIWRTYVKGLQIDNRTHVQWGRVDIVWLDK